MKKLILVFFVFLLIFLSSCVIINPEPEKIEHGRYTEVEGVNTFKYNLDQE